MSVNEDDEVQVSNNPELPYPLDFLLQILEAVATSPLPYEGFFSPHH